MTRVSNQRGIQSLQLGINILNVFLKEKKPLKFSEIKNATGMTKSNLYKYLYTLTQSGLIYNNPVDRTYMLGNRLIEYGNIALEHLDIIPTIESALEEIGEETTLTSLFATWHHESPVIAHIHSVDYGINIGAQMGNTLPISSSSGKIFSAFKYSQEKEKWELKELNKLTETKRKEFKKEQEVIRKEKFSFTIEPLIQHISSISVPILDFKKNLVGAITVVGFTPLIPKHSKDEKSQYVLSVAKRVSKKLGYKGEF